MWNIRLTVTLSLGHPKPEPDFDSPPVPGDTYTDTVLAETDPTPRTIGFMPNHDQ
ncbi:hypothetical protein [Trueperella sp. LYQ143]|uniref:hypothetical protein n=1 Tax=unclassified Trueperella TaxID=2630174 RepID=UPI0039830A2B